MNRPHEIGAVMTKRVRPGIASPKTAEDATLRQLLKHSSRYKDANTEMDAAIATLRKEKGSEGLVRFLFSSRVWGDYDRTMRGHTDVIDYLLGLVIGLNDSPMMRGVRGPFGENLHLLDIGGGTGEIERLIYRRLGNLRWKEAVKDARILDLSQDMVHRAREKFEKEGIVMPNGDETYIFKNVITDGIELPVAPNLVVMSQVLPFLRAETRGNMAAGSPDTAKRLEVIRKLVNLVETGGYFLLIDEDPMLLTIHGEHVSEIIRSKLFNETIVPIQRTEVIAGIMKNLADKMEFVAEFRCPIDGKHGMYAMLYRVKPNRDDELDVMPEEGFAEVRLEAREKVLETLRGLESLKIHGNIPYINVNNTGLIKVVSEVRESDNPPGYIIGTEAGSDRLDSVILVDSVGSLGNGTRKRMFKDLVSKVRKGGSIVVVDEWPSRPESAHPITNRNFRDGLMGGELGADVTPLASLRLQMDARFSSAVFGYEFRKISE